MKENKKKEKLKYFCKEYLPYILIIVFVLFIKQFIVSPIKVNGDSMFKTLHDGDIMILDKISYNFSEIKRFDIVVVDDGSEFIIKRVIGLPGEKIEYRNNILYINGKKIKDNYASSDTNDFIMVVPDDKYFVLGDNRASSKDSRFYGAFSEKEILGKAKLVLLPFNRFGNKK